MVTERRPHRLTRTDLLLLLVVVAFVIVGLVMVKSASYGFALFEGGSFEGRPNHFFHRQLIWAVVGLVAMAGMSLIDYRVWGRYAFAILLASVALLGAMVLFGRETHQTVRWVLYGSVQPAEFVKVGVLIYIAAWLASRGDRLRGSWPGLVAFTLVLGLVAALILMQPDFSTVVILVLTATAMFFAAGASAGQMVTLLGGGFASAWLLVRLSEYRYERLRVFLEGPFSDPTGDGMQLIQSLLALNRGGWLGVGLGHSQQKFAIYAPHTDGMFAIIGEELGIIGALGVLVLYGLWAWRGFRVAWHAPDAYGRILAVGLTAWTLFQATVHIGVVTASVPFTGTVLPMVSYGGSSLTSALLAAGLLLSISRGHRAQSHPLAERLPHWVRRPLARPPAGADLLPLGAIRPVEKHR